MTERSPAQQPSLPSAAPAPTKRKTRPWVAGAIVLLPALAAAFGVGNIEKAGAASPTGDATAAIISANSASAATDVAALTTVAPSRAVAVAFSPAKRAPSSDQRNATQSAEQYLDMTAFSRSGLIHQLEYEGYSTEDATFAVDSLNADWNEQAARSAKQYLEMTSFSRSGLIDQLVYEGFTQEQAVYGANAAY